MGNEMLRSLLVVGYGNWVEKRYMAVLMSFSLKGKYLPVA